MSFEVDETTECSTMSPKASSSSYNEVKRPIDSSKVTTITGSPVDFSQLRINADPAVALWQASKQQQDENELKRIVEGFQSKITDFVVDLLKHDDDILNRSNHLKSQLKAQICKATPLRSELDRQKIDESKERIAELTGQLEAAKLSESKANSTIHELHETASKLTEWNSQLEEKCRRLEREKEELVEINLKVQKELEAEILEISEKRISLAQQYTEQEENVSMLKRSLAEHQEIEEKLKQENSVLKSNFFNLVSKNDEKELKLFQGPPQCKSSSSFERPNDLGSLDLMEDVKLIAEQRTITDIFKTSFPT